jgi:hypothetical protein
MTEQNERVLMYEKAIGELAEQRTVGFLPLYNKVSALPGDLTENGIHFSDEGYRKVAGALWGDHLDEHLSYEQLRSAVLKKNQLFFYSYRPQNETYLRGFRKHEQGNNAVEITQFEPLVEAEDRRIHAVLKGGAE